LELRIAQEYLSRLVSTVSKTAPKNPASLAIYSALRLEVAQEDGVNLLKVSGYNGDFGMELIADDFDAVTPGTVCLDGRLLTGIISGLSARQTVVIRTEPNQNDALIRCATHAGKVRTFDPQDFPRWGKEFNPDKSTVLVRTSDLKNALTKTLFCSGEKTGRPALNSVALQVNPKAKRMIIAASNGASLAMRLLPVALVQEKKAEDLEVLIPKDTAQELTSILSPDEYGQLEIGFSASETSLIFKSADSSKFRFAASVVEGKFPDFTGLVKRPAIINTVASVEELLEALRVGMPLVRATKAESDASFILTFIPASDSSLGKLVIQTITPHGTAQSELEVAVSGNEPKKLRLRPQQLMPILRAITTGKVVLQIGEADNEPLLIRPEESATERFLYANVPLCLPGEAIKPKVAEVRVEANGTKEAKSSETPVPSATQARMELETEEVATANLDEAVGEEVALLEPAVALSADVPAPDYNYSNEPLPVSSSVEAEESDFLE
jgi:DNA polymerase III sliding clamp (beta) subunit (PCNA family)